MYGPNEVGKRIFRVPTVTFSGAGGIFNWPRGIMGSVIPVIKQIFFKIQVLHINICEVQSASGFWINHRFQQLRSFLRNVPSSSFKIALHQVTMCLALIAPLIGLSLQFATITLPRTTRSLQPGAFVACR